MSEGIRERIEVMVVEFIINLDKHDPFEHHLMEFSMKLKSKLLEVANLGIQDRNAVENSLLLAMEGLEAPLTNFITQFDKNDKVLTERYIRTLEEVSKILKEIADMNIVSDRATLCRISSKFEDNILTLRTSDKRNKGIKSFLYRLFGQKL